MRHVHAAALALLLACQEQAPPVTDTAGPGLARAYELASADEGTTVAHRLLGLERRFGRVCNGQEDASWWAERVERLDALLEAVDGALVPHDPSNWATWDRDEVTAALTTVDRAMHEEGYLVCIGIGYLGRTFGPAVAGGLDAIPTRIELGSKRTCDVDLSAEHRGEAARKHLSEGFHPYDCDLGSHIVMSVAERWGWPMTFVHIPGHMFVRWHFADGSTMNWDTNKGRSVSDDEYRRNKGWKHVLEREDLGYTRNGWLEDEDEASIRGWYLTWLFSRTDSAACKLDALDMALDTGRPLPATSQNRFAWALVTRPALRSPDNHRMALTLAEDAVRKDPQCHYWDTLSCALAANGRHAEAVAVEIAHISPDSPRIPYFQAGMDCFEPFVAQEGGCPKSGTHDSRP